MAHQDGIKEEKNLRETFIWKDGEFQITRISDDEYYDKWQNGLPIREDYSLLLDISCREGLSLGEMLVSMEHIFGGKGPPFDDFKGTFGFQFLLVVNNKFPYLFMVGDLKGVFYYSLYKITDDEKPFPSVYIKPIENEFSADKIRYFVNFFYGYIEGFFKGMSSRVKSNNICSFINHVHSSNIVYGYWQNKFHQKQFESWESLEKYKEEVLSIIQSESVNKELEPL